MESQPGKPGEAAQSWGRDLGTWKTLSQITEKLQQVFLDGLNYSVLSQHEFLWGDLFNAHLTIFLPFKNSSVTFCYMWGGLGWETLWIMEVFLPYVLRSEMWQVQTLTATAVCGCRLLCLSRWDLSSFKSRSQSPWSRERLGIRGNGFEGLLCTYIPHLPWLCSASPLLSSVHTAVSRVEYVLTDVHVIIVDTI